jgi:hypothetical protein
MQGGWTRLRIGDSLRRTCVVTKSRDAQKGPDHTRFGGKPSALPWRGDSKKESAPSALEKRQQEGDASGLCNRDGRRPAIRRTVERRANATPGE